MERGQIFVSYRRQDSRPWAARLVDDLRDYFGRERVFRDIDSNRSGQDYVRQIEEAIKASQVMIAVIGPDWVHIADDRGYRRLSEDEDPIRIELETAFTQDVPLIPVLVDGAAMPQRRDLPSSIDRLARIQACRMSDDDWQYDLGRLLEAMESHGVFAPRTVTAEPSRAEQPEEPRGTTRYERKMQASRRRVYDAVTATVENLGYRVIEEQPEAAKLTFQPRSAGARETTAKVVDAGPGSSMVVVELVKVHTGGLVAVSMAAALPTAFAGLLTWPAVRAWERTYASGFLDNVTALLEGRGIGQDSALLPGLHQWRNRSREV